MGNKFKIITILVIIAITTSSIILFNNKQVNENYKAVEQKELNKKIEETGKFIQTNIIKEKPNIITNNFGKSGVDKTSERHGEIIPHNLIFRDNETSVPTINKLLSATQFDVKYDPRTVNMTTPVKNQGFNGTCWAFSSLGALETFMKTKSVDVDASEEHVRFVLSNNQNAKNYNRGYLNRTPDDGGNFLMTAAYLTNGFGYVNEAQAPYNPNLNGSWTFPTNLKPTKIVDDIVIDDYDVQTLKNKIITNGAVDASIYVGSNINGNYYNTTTKSYYYNGSSQNDHEVILVGWDDDYNKTNFNALNRPQNNGAWLVKNSWGTTFGDNGYFWISYEDTGLNSVGNLFYSVKNVEDIKSNEKFLTNATLGPTNFLYSGSNQYFTMEVFNLDSDAKEITEVTLFTLEKNLGYGIFIACLDDETPQPIPVATNMFTDFGYTTAKLITPYQITKPGRYAIYVMVSHNDESERIVPVEMKTSLHEPVINPNSSYMLNPETGEFDDYSQYGINFVNRITVESSAVSGDYRYVVNDSNKAEIVKYTGNATSLTIPSTLNSLEVEGIDSSTFDENNSTINTLVVSEGINYIEAGTLSKCSNLESITIPSTITSLDGVLTLVKNLKNVTISGNNPNYTTLDNIVYSKDMTRLVQYPLGKIDTDYIMPSTVTTLSSDAIDGTKSLENLTISDNLVNIDGTLALDGVKIKNIYVSNNSIYDDIDGVLVSKDLKNLIIYPSGKANVSYRIPDSIEKLLTGAFRDTRSLPKLIFPKNVTNVESNAIVSNGTLMNLQFFDNAPTITSTSFSLEPTVQDIFTIEKYPWKTGFNTSDWQQYNLVNLLSDLNGHWGRNVIEKWVLRGMTAGHGITKLYYPNQYILKADIIYTINRLMNYTNKRDISFLKDVKSTDWYYTDMQKAVSAGYIYPFDLNYIKPNDTLNREQFMTMVSIALNLPNANLNVLDKYTDKNNISKINKQFVANYIGKFGFAGNMINGKLCLIPQNLLTKADTFYFIDLAFDTYDNTQVVVNNRPNDTVGHWSGPIIEKLISMGLTASHGITKCYYPDDYILKADLLYTINRIMGYTATSTPLEMSQYTDVKSTDWYYTDASKALKAGYIYPLGANSIYPNNKVTREQLFVMISKSKNLPNADLSVLNKYTDKDTIDPTIIQYVANYIGAFGFDGNMINGKLCLIPKNPLTKADLMYFINNTLED